MRWAGPPFAMETHDTTTLEVTAVGDKETLIRGCVDCGLFTGRFCDYCYAKERVPTERWAKGQLTPLCSKCDNAHGSCHFCRNLKWCTPPSWGLRGEK